MVWGVGTQSVRGTLEEKRESGLNMGVDRAWELNEGLREWRKGESESSISRKETRDDSDVTRDERGRIGSDKDKGKRGGSGMGEDKHYSKFTM